jgi:hypothetical protein
MPRQQDEVWKEFSQIEETYNSTTKRWKVSCNHCRGRCDGRSEMMRAHIAEHCIAVPAITKLRFLNVQAEMAVGKTTEVISLKKRRSSDLVNFLFGFYYLA